MAIFVDQGTKVIVQGLTGGQGRFHGLRNRDYGTQVVAGVTPGKGGQDVEGIPIFDTCRDAVAATGADASFVAVPPKAAPAAILEAARGRRSRFVVCITEGIPAQDEALVFNTLRREHPGTRLLGPNCPGIISPGKCNIGITAGEIAQLPDGRTGPNVGIVSRSGTLTYQALYELKQKGIGVSTCVGIGGDPVPGHVVRRLPDRVREGPGDARHHAHRRDRRLGRGGGGGVHHRHGHQADERLHRRGHRAGRARRWATPAPSSPGARARRRGRWTPCAAAGVKVGLNPTEAGELMAEIVAGL